MNNEMVLPPRDRYFMITSLRVYVADPWSNIMANNLVYADLYRTVRDLKWGIARRMGYPIASQHRVFTQNRVEIFDHRMVEIFDHQMLLPFLNHPHAEVYVIVANIPVLPPQLRLPFPLAQPGQPAQLGQPALGDAGSRAGSNHSPGQSGGTEATNEEVAIELENVKTKYVQFYSESKLSLETSLMNTHLGT
ncbi:hypothetical protein MKW92_021278, partial [Papaver armeniacum]